MSIQITNEGLTVKILDTAPTPDRVENYNKIGTGVFVADTNSVIVREASGRSTTINYNDVTVPSVASAEELREKIIEFINDTVTTIIDLAHHEVHEGDAYSVNHITTDSFNLAFKVPANAKKVHFVLKYSAESKAEIHLYEGREWDTGTGSKINIFNRDRNSSNESIVEEDSGGSFGGNMAVVLNPGNPGIGGNAAGVDINGFETWSDKKQTVSERGHSERILKSNEVYVVSFVSNDGVKGSQLEFCWYEKES